MTSPAARVLLASADAELRPYLRRHLEVDGFAVATVGDAAGALAALRGAGADLAVIDTGLPDAHGLGVLREARAAGIGTPVILLSHCGEEAHKVRGLKLGADDVVVLPVGAAELCARVEAVLRRTRAASPSPAPMERFGAVEVDAGARAVRRDGREVRLVPREMDLLLALLAREGRVASRPELLREVWGHAAAVTTRTVDTHVAGLRAKLEADPASPVHLLTVWKAGYRLQR